MSSAFSKKIIGFVSAPGLKRFWKLPWGPIHAVGFGFVGLLSVQFSLTVLWNIIFDLSGDGVVINAVFYALGAAATALLLWWVLRQKGGSLKDLGVKNKIAPKRLLVLTGVGFLCYFLLSVLTQVLAVTIYPDIDLNQTQELGFSLANTVPGLVLIFISLVLIPPIAEELIFRGFIFGGFRTRLNFVWAAVISSILFGFAHFQLNVGMDTAALGLVSCWLYERTDSLWPSLALHGLKNLIAFALIFVLPLS